MSDLISREKTLYQLATSAVYYFDLEEDTAAHNWAMHIVSGMPDEEPDQKWIPADNPPETDDYILLSFENYSVPMVGRYGDCKYYVGDETEPLCKQDIFVNAWMPLPEPYKEGRADEVD